MGATVSMIMYVVDLSNYNFSLKLIKVSMSLALSLGNVSMAISQRWGYLISQTKSPTPYDSSSYACVCMYLGALSSRVI